jgi:hypothetical protein
MHLDPLLVAKHTRAVRDSQSDSRDQERARASTELRRHYNPASLPQLAGHPLQARRPTLGADLVPGPNDADRGRDRTAATVPPIRTEGSPRTRHRGSRPAFAISTTGPWSSRGLPGFSVVRKSVVLHYRFWAVGPLGSSPPSAPLPRRHSLTVAIHVALPLQPIAQHLLDQRRGAAVVSFSRAFQRQLHVW